MQFYMPTQVVSGKDCVLANAEKIAAFGKKAMIVTGRSSAEKNGSLADVKAALEKCGTEYIVYNKIKSNPDIESAYEGAKAANENKADFIIAIGGGSPMDAAKAIALLSRQDIPQEELFSGAYSQDVMPMVFIPTTAGTGSEVTPYSILTNKAKETKTSIASPVIFPKLAILDGKYMLGLPIATTINTAIDALSHSVEGMLSNKANTVSDILAEKSIKMISECFEPMKNDSLGIEDRNKLLYASTLAGMVIAHTGTTAVHSMGYSLTYFKDIDHGRANGLLLAEFLRLVEKAQGGLVKKILSFAGCADTDEFAGVIDSLLGEKEKVTLGEAKKYASIAIKAKNIANCIFVPNEEDLLNIYKSVFNCGE